MTPNETDEKLKTPLNKSNVEGRVMCAYCKTEETMMETETISPSTTSFCEGIKEADIWRHTYKLGVFIDTRGYLRMVDLDDCNCLDGGEKIKINFCPVCGDKINT